MRNGGSLQLGDHRIHGVVSVFRVRRRSLGVRRDLQLVWLEHSPQTVQEHGRIILGPKVQVHRMQPVHVLAIVLRIWRGEMPLAHVLLRAGRRASPIAAEAVDGQGEQARVLVRLLDLDGVQV